MGDIIHIRYCGHCRRPVNHTKRHTVRTVPTPTGETEILFHVTCQTTQPNGPGPTTAIARSA